MSPPVSPLTYTARLVFFQFYVLVHVPFISVYSLIWVAVLSLVHENFSLHVVFVVLVCSRCT
jgi:hypothetical protein